MRIGINGQDFNPGNTGGSETYFRDLVDGLPRDNPHVDFFVYVSARFVNNLDHKYQNLKYSLLDSKYEVLNRITRKLNLKQNIIYQKLDILHFTFQRTDLGCASYPVVVTFHDIQDSYFPENFSYLELKQRQAINRRAIKESNHIIAISEFTKNTLIEKYKVEATKISVVYHGIDPLYFRQTTELDPSNKYFYYPAASWPHKNHLRLLRAFKLILNKYPDFKLVMSGASKQEAVAIKNFITENKLTQSIKHLGYVNYKDLPELYAKAFTLIFPSLFEGFGYPVAEAMASGCPVLCSNTTSLPEVGGKSVLYFDPTSEREIFDSMERIIIQPNIRNKLIKDGKQQAKKFTKESMLKETFAVYKKIIQEYAHEK